MPVKRVLVYYTSGVASFHQSQARKVRACKQVHALFDIPLVSKITDYGGVFFVRLGNRGCGKLW